MIKQSEIKISDLHPGYNPKSYSRQGLNKQDAFLFEVHSMPLYCPSCKQPHTINELLINSPEFKTGMEAGNGTINVNLFCPSTGIELKHWMGLFSEQGLVIK